MTRLVPLVLLFTILTNCGGEPARGSSPTAGSHPPCSGQLEGPYPVTHVSDGDTIMIGTGARKSLTVRLIGVDAPEMDGPYRAAEPGGAQSRMFVVSFLSGQSVYLEADAFQERRDKHGRQLAYVYRARDCVLLNGEIIRQGYGQSYRRFRFRHRELFDRYEREARRSGLGLWNQMP